VFSGGRDLAAYLIYDSNPDNPWEYAIVAHNNANGENSLDTLNMTWNMVVNHSEAGTETIQQVSERYTMQPNETVVLYQLRRNSEWPSEVAVEDIIESEDAPGFSWLLAGGIIIGTVAIAGGVLTTFLIKKRSQ